MLATAAATIAALAGLASATKAPPYNDKHFRPPTSAPWVASANYTGQSNYTIQNVPLVKGRSFDRFIQIWLENTDFEDAAANHAFQSLAKQGILLKNYYALTHPSQPNYMASAGGSFWGLHDDALYNIPTNMSTIVDLLEDKHISWASYQENMPEDGYQGFTYTSQDYLSGSGDYTYYCRKHNPTIHYNAVAESEARRARHRNWNDFAADFNASALSQWVYITPNLVNDAHDTSTEFTGHWLNFWLEPLLKDQRFNDDRTLIVLTFDETETYEIPNNVYTLLLGGAVPKELRGTEDSTFYTHYSLLTTVEGNWGLDSLGRGDANKTMSNIFEPYATSWGWKNQQVPESQIPPLNEFGTIGPLVASAWYTWPAPEFPNAKSPGGGPVFIRPGTDMSLKIKQLEKHPVNLTALGESVPSAGYPPWYDDDTFKNAPERLKGSQPSASQVIAERSRYDL